MFSKHLVFLLAVAVLGMVALNFPATAGIPNHFSYQGMLLDHDAPFTGTAQFKFALVDTFRNTTVWSNDGTNGYPTQSVAVDVQAGVFSVLVGAPPMVPIDPTLIAGFTGYHALRIWVDLGHGEIAMGNLPLSSALFAHKSMYAEKSHGPFTAEGVIWSQSSGFKFPDGTIQTTAASGGTGTTSSTLDEAYDGGGAGLGRFIIADQGAVSISGAGGLLVEGNTILINKLGIGTFSPEAPLQISTNQWDVANTYGDLMLGNTDYGLRMGMAMQGVGAGTARIRAVGGTNRFYLGAGIADVVKVDTVGFHVITGPFQVNDNGRLNVTGNFGSNHAGAAATLENTNAAGIALWAETGGSDAVMVAQQSGTGPLFKGFQGGTETFRVDADGRMIGTHLEVTEGQLQIDSIGKIHLSGDFGTVSTGAALNIYNTASSGLGIKATTTGAGTAILAIQSGTGPCFLATNGQDQVFRVNNTGEVIASLVTCTEVDADQVTTDNIDTGTINTGTIHITGGADLAEPFAMSEAPDQIEPGSIMAIDPDNPGSLKLSRVPYDTRVAGVVSGAGGVNPGLTLRQNGMLDEGRHLALSGRVYLRASTVNGAIRPGDMMTSSELPGIAMRATDREKSFGAVVGKAMTSLESGEGLVLVLVGLQ